MSDQIDLESLKDKLAKLLAKAEGTNNEAEAEAFMAKVNQLLEQHQIGMHEIRNRTGKVTDPVGHEWGSNKIPSSLAWYRAACSAIAQYYGCRFIYYKYRNGKVPYKIVGPQSSRITAELMMPFIISQVRQVSRKYMRENNDRAVREWGSVDMAKAVGDYLTEVKAQTHVGLALISRIHRLIRANDAHRRDIESKALVPVDTNQQYIDDHFGKLKIGRSSTGSTTHEAMAAAEKISLHVQTEHDKRRMIE